MSGALPWKRSVRIFARSCRGEPIGGTAGRPLRTRLGSRTPRRGCSTQDPKAYSLRSRKVEAIEVHHLGPRRDEVLDELRLRIRASVDLRQGPELGVRTEDEIDRVPVHLSSPVARSRPSDTSLASDTTFHSVPMSSRFTKKSLVSASGRLVKTPCFVCPTLVFKTRMPPTRTVISGAVSVSNCARSTSNSSADTGYLPLR